MKNENMKRGKEVSNMKEKWLEPAIEVVEFSKADDAILTSGDS